MMIRCERCGSEHELAARGRTPRYCSDACKQAAYRSRRIPTALTSRPHWVRADGKRPLQPHGRLASSTDRATWSPFAKVRKGAGDGFGFMLGDGIGAYDLDHVTDTEAREFIAAIPEPIIYAERSRSGEGVHVFVEAPPTKGHRRGGFEFYSQARFIRMTGVAFR